MSSKSPQKTPSAKKATKAAAKKTAKTPLAKAPAKNPAKTAAKSRLKKSAIGRTQAQIRADSLAASKARDEAFAAQRARRKAEDGMPLRDLLAESLANEPEVNVGAARWRLRLKAETFENILQRAGILPVGIVLEHATISLTNANGRVYVLLLVSRRATNPKKYALSNTVVTLAVPRELIEAAVVERFPKLSRRDMELYLVASNGARGITPATEIVLLYDYVAPSTSRPEDDEIAF